MHSSLNAVVGGYACYMHSMVLGRLLKSIGIEYRNYSMMKNEKNHHVAEVKIEGKWVVADPLFNIVFNNQDGILAGAKELNEDFGYYRRQIVDSVYYDRFDYEYDYDYIPSKKGIIKRLAGDHELIQQLLVNLSLNKYLAMQVEITVILLGWLLFFVF